MAVAREPQRIAGQLGGVRIFAAEDEPMLLIGLEDMLSELGCRVVGTATRIAQALDLIASHSFDAAILDVKLHDESIDPVADALAARAVPVVLATGYAPTALAQRFAGFPMVQKPYSLDDLRQALLLALAQHGHV